ncbi:MAG: hypothetical protein FJW99_00310 [Actinobacteria bacterium]|nr:hypothetical protein [Actinomycetota bacterium]MBM3697940.1 hypothetical protein [Actinomycetota bacterium]
MSDDHQPSLQERLRPVCAVLGGIGALLSVLASFVAVEASSMGGIFYTLGYHSGGWAGAVAFLMALITVGGALVVRRSPALGSTLMYVGGCGGFLACGGIWLIPGTITLVAANLALWAITDPFRDGPAGART